MRKSFAYRVLGAVSVVLLAFALSSEASAQQAANQSLTPRDLSSFRAIAEDTLAVVNTGNLKRARARIKDMETGWDRAEAKLRPRSPEQWRTIDKAVDAALLHLLVDVDRPNQSSSVAPGKTEAVEPKRSITDIVAAVEKLQPGASLLDVSFEPKDGQPVYAVRTYANGKVWDGLIDGLTGAAIGSGTVVDESALDDEDKAELAASIHAKITLRQAIETAEKANHGRALNGGLEQGRGRVG